MAEYLHSLLGPSGSLSFFGDDDGGRFFHPYGAARFRPSYFGDVQVLNSMRVQSTMQPARTNPRQLKSSPAVRKGLQCR